MLFRSENPLVLSGLDFAAGAAVLRFKAVTENEALAKGVNTAQGKVTYEAVATAHHIPYTPLKDVLQAVSI